MPINQCLAYYSATRVSVPRTPLAWRVMDHQESAALVEHFLLYAKARMVSNAVRRIVL